MLGGTWQAAARIQVVPSSWQQEIREQSEAEKVNGSHLKRLGW